MKVTFEINTNESQEQDELITLTKALDMRIALWDIDKLLRNTIKYENQLHDDYLTEEEENAIEYIQKKFNELLEERDLTQHVLEMP